MTDPLEAVRERNLDLMFDELAGRDVAPDRTAAILRRCAEPAPERRRSLDLRVRQLGVAAALLLGVGVTFAVAWTRVGSEDAVAPTWGGSQVTGPVAAVVAQDPQPKPQPRPAPVAQEPKPESQPRPDPAKRSPPPEPKGKPKPDHAPGSSPEDLRALRSAEAMLAAERKLSKLLLEGKIPGVKERIDFADLTGWTYQKGLEGMPPEVKALDGRKVLMTGFMLPIDEVTGMRRFLLVQSLWACCYGTPPDIHGLVRCVMPKDQTTDYEFEPIRVVGTFRVAETIEDGYVVDIYQLHVESLAPIR